MFFIRRRDQFHVWLIMRRLSPASVVIYLGAPHQTALPLSTTPQRNNSTHNKSVWKTASTPDTGRDRFQTGFKERGQQVHLTYIISCSFSKSKFWLIGCFWLFLMIFDGLQIGESCWEKVAKIMLLLAAPSSGLQWFWFFALVLIIWIWIWEWYLDVKGRGW